MVSIIDYGMGNIASVKKALNILNVESQITSDHQKISTSSHIILPGVGSFSQGMNNLQERGLDKLLKEEILVKKKPFLGICLGMQLIFSAGTEPFPCQGLGWIKGRVEKISAGQLRIPHMGWNNIDILKPDFFPEKAGEDYYFIHSYHVIPDDSTTIAATVSYGIDLVASVQHDNIFATQFHPEKSQQAGLNLLKNCLTKHA